MAYHSNGYNETPERSNNENNKPTYLMEHLATFTVTSETGIVYPADGMRRLLQLEKTNGIWSQKMQLCLDHPWVLIMDYETGVSLSYFSYLYTVVLLKNSRMGSVKVKNFRTGLVKV